jgi:uncharacterized membrane protein
MTPRLDWVVGLIGLVAAVRGRPVPAKITSTALVLSLATTALMARTANLGGQIHHEEIRSGAPATPPEREIGEAR